MKAIACKLCRRVSWNANDVRERYCGACHVFLEEGQFEILEEERDEA